MLMILQYCSNGALDRLLAMTPDITTAELAEFIQGIAEGMRFLASKKFCHRDLAARNVLVNAANCSKIADFGLSRNMEQQDFYQQANASAKLPLRWCAPEVLNGLTFSEASDVWSYGVVIDEVYNRGAFPYPGWNNARVIEMISEHGYCLPQAQGCPDLVYKQITRACLQTKPEDRPTFETICKAFPDMKMHKLWRRSSVEKPKVANKRDRRIAVPDDTLSAYLQPVPIQHGDNTYLEPVPTRRGDRAYVDNGEKKWVDGVPMTQTQFDLFGGLTGSEQQTMLRDMVRANSADASILPDIGGSLESDATLAYVEFGATDDLPTTISPDIPAPTKFPKLDAPTLLAAGGTGEVDEDPEEESVYAAPDFVGGTTQFPKRDAPTLTLLAAGGTGGIDVDPEEESVYAAPDFVPVTTEL